MTSPALTTQEHEALVRLLSIARRDTHQAGKVARFLLAWWNAEECGGFDLTDTWGVDDAIAQDILTVFPAIVRTNAYPDALGYAELFEHVVKMWKPQKSPMH